MADGRTNKIIETLEDLLSAMWTTHWSTSSHLHYRQRNHTSPYVIISQDCNYYVDQTMYSVSPGVAEEAVRRGLVTGTPQWGGVSKFDWQLTEAGKEVAIAIRRRAEQSKRDANLRPIVDHDMGDCDLRE